jgi:hypothetical protein
MSFDPLEYRRRTVKSGRAQSDIYLMAPDLIGLDSFAELETWNLKLETIIHVRISH